MINKDKQGGMGKLLKAGSIGLSLALPLLNGCNQTKASVNAIFNGEGVVCRTNDRLLRAIEPYRDMINDLRTYGWMLYVHPNFTPGGDGTGMYVIIDVMPTENFSGERNNQKLEEALKLLIPQIEKGMGFIERTTVEVNYPKVQDEGDYPIVDSVQIAQQ